MLLLVFADMCQAQQTLLSALLVVVITTASAKLTMAQPAAAAANLSADAWTLLQEQAWADASNGTLLPACVMTG